MQPATTIPRLAPQCHTVTYMARPSNIALHSSFKRWRLIDDSVYVLTSHYHHVSEPAPPDPNTLDLHPPFSSSTNLSSASLGKTPTAFAAVDNKVDTLTQSQMLKDPDWAFFLDLVDGVPIGVGVEMPRTEAVFDEKVKWGLGECDGEMQPEVPSYRS
ncbi:MAG: hypothetical protein ACK53Y_06955, partial [bacterium]